nr:outward-rectifier potassium channel tok1 [Quercus suber]
MRMVQDAAERDRQYLSLAISLAVATSFWFLGAAVFMVLLQLRATFIVLKGRLIRQKDLTPKSNAGRAFFVLWSILAVPTLTIMVSDLSDTFIRWFSQIAPRMGRASQLNRRHGSRAQKHAQSRNVHAKVAQVDGTDENEPIDGDEHFKRLMRRVADRLADHIDTEELQQALDAENVGDELGRDIHFYHYVLSRECRELQKSLRSCPSKQYSWHDWEYYLRLAGSVNHATTIPPLNPIHESFVISSVTATGLLKSSMATATTVAEDGLSSATAIRPSSGTIPQHDGAVDRATELQSRLKWNQHQKRLRRVFTRHSPSFNSTLRQNTASAPAPTPSSARLAGRQHQRQLTDVDLQEWSWLSDRSPLASSRRTETQWILELLSRALVADLDAVRKGARNVPPVGMRDAALWGRDEGHEKEGEENMVVRHMVSSEGVEV